jgi:hypothetical protein
LIVIWIVVFLFWSFLFCILKNSGTCMTPSSSRLKKFSITFLSMFSICSDYLCSSTPMFRCLVFCWCPRGCACSDIIFLVFFLCLCLIGLIPLFIFSPPYSIFNLFHFIHKVFNWVFIRVI